jgi:hypothetical protein
MYLEGIGGSLIVIGGFGFLQNFLSAFWSLPGGYIADIFGNKRAFLIFNMMAMCGYITDIFLRMGSNLTPCQHVTHFQHIKRQENSHGCIDAFYNKKISDDAGTYYRWISDYKLRTDNGNKDMFRYFHSSLPDRYNLSV